MGGSSARAQARNRSAGSADDDASSESSTLNFSQSITFRLRRWSLALGASVVCFGTVCDILVSDLRDEAVPVAATTYHFITLAVALLVTIISSIFLFKVYTTKEEDVSPSGNVWELVCALIALFLWVINLMFGFMAGGRKATSGFGFLRSANMYYSLWFGFGALLGVIVEFLRTFRDMDVLTTIHSRGSRFGLWLLFSLTSFVLLVSSTNIFCVVGCRAIDEASIPDDVNYTFKDIETLCNRTGLGIGLGACLTFICFMFVCELWYVKENPEQLFASESLFSFLSFVSMSVSTGYITSDRGPAARIGNLYYATWFCLLISARLCLSCFREFQDRKKLDKERLGIGLQI